jgi:hypothetical protein
MKPRKCLFAAILVSLLVSAATAAGASWQELMDEAEALLTAGKTDSAGVVLTEALSKSLTQCEGSAAGVQPGVSYFDENPLLLSGLFFAGANLHGEGSDDAGAEDGILTAYEVSALDLEGTELVVLSACETGLGEVAEGEGVYGLRLAFQMAGARTVVSALWPVSDEATAVMMGQLYGRSDEVLPEAMRRVQLKKLAKRARKAAWTIHLPGAPSSLSETGSSWVNPRQCDLHTCAGIHSALAG